MTMIRYNIQTGANGSIMIPATPFAVGEKVEVVLMERYRETESLEDDWQSRPMNNWTKRTRCVAEFSKE